MRPKALARALARGVVALAVALVILAAMLATEPGTQWIVAVVDWWAGDRFRVGRVSGSLARTVRMYELEIRHPTLDLSVAEVELSWDPAKLLSGEAHLDALAMDGVRLGLHESPFSRDEGPPAAWAFTLAAPSVTITDFSVEAGGEAIPIESLTLSTHSSATAVEVSALEAAGATWSLTANGALERTEPFDLNVQARWTRHVDGAAQEGRLTIAGDSQVLRFDATMHAPIELRSVGEVKRTPQGHEIEATGAWRDLQWPPFGPPTLRSPEGRFELGGALEDLNLALDLELAIGGLPHTRLTLEGTGSVEPSARLPFDLNAGWRASMGPDATLSGGLDANGDERNIVVDLNLLTPFPASAEATLALGEEPRFDAVAQWSELLWPLSGKRVLLSREGRLEAKGSSTLAEVDLAAALEVPQRVHDGHVRATATLTGMGRPQVSGSFEWDARIVASGETLRGSGTLHGNPFSALDFTHALSAPFELRTEGVVDSPFEAPELRLAGTWRNLHWSRSPLVSGYRSDTGTYTLNGPMDAMEIRLDGTLDANTLPSAQVTLTGTVDETGINLDPLLIRALGGRTTARGRLGWRPDIRWKIEVDARGLDPGRQWPQWEGALDGTALLQGELVDGVVRTEADVRHLEGRLRDYPIKAEGRLEIAGERLRAQGVSLRSGDNRLQLDGVYDREMDVEFLLEASDLGAVFPDAAGRLVGEGVAQGAIASPRVKALLTGQNIRYRDWGAGSLEVDADVSDAQSPSQVVLTARDARAGKHRIGVLELRADGNTAAHTARITARSTLGDLHLRATGGMEAARWRGELMDAALLPSDGGAWRLAQPAGLNVERDRIAVERTCLVTEEGAGVCADFERTDTGQARASLSIEALPLSLLQPWLPAQSTATGELNAKGAWSLVDGRLAGNIAASVSPGELTVARGQSERLAVAHADTEITVMVEEDRAALKFGSVLAGNARVQGSLVLEGLHEEGSLDGAIEASVPRLEAIAALVDGPSTFEGEAFVEARIGGSVATPRAQGVARIEVERARIHDLGIELSDSWVEVRAEDESRVAVGGVLRSGEGHLNINGEGLLEMGGWTPNAFFVTGESFEVVRLPEAVVTVSPDVTVSAAGDLLTVNGRALIPQARITPVDIAGDAVDVSSDEVLLDRTGKVSQPETDRGPEVAVDLVVVLGDEVVFDGFGLLSRLAGELRARHTPGGAPTAFGALDLIEGQFSIYGQQLDIEHGRVIFAGPLDDPGLDIRAVRRVGETTAGIIIAGTVSNPSSTIYSEPALDEAEAFSVLLTGHGLSSADEREAALLSQAALSLGLKGSESVGIRIRSVLGLDELTVGNVGAAGGASLILGKRLNSDFGVRYVHWLARQAGSVFVNYRLTDRLSLEAESGVRQGLDVLYSIESDRALP